MAEKDIRKYLVVKGNDLIQKAKFNLTETEQKLVAMCIACVDPKGKELPKYNIRVDKFAKLCGLSKDHLYSDFREIIEAMAKKSLWIKMPDGKMTYFHWFPYASYFEGEGRVELELNKELRPYLQDIHKSFTKYEIWNVLCLRGKYSIRLYELMASYLNLGKYEISIKELRENLCGDNKYENFKDFRMRVLDKSIREINEKTNLFVNYETKGGGQGRKVTSIIFSIEVKSTYQATAAYEHFTEQMDGNDMIVGQMSLFDYINGDI